ncbi:HD-GYP domain-containing protein [Marinobacter halophilus]|uniref:Phosphohydrolase n=1 Tax=Marinobacter halophilus TaxID=1323740 RepID=A0A2T1KET0_9GAMM|nr:HD-GYP domain-containing protein [Marinobacter halophilus]PSF08052.1 phosphohydrolase [Marinobacter halophilus]
MPLFRKSKSKPEQKTIKRLDVNRDKDILSFQAQVGMRVTALDRPWNEVPVLFQSFVIENEEQLAILKRYCRTITVASSGEEAGQVETDSSKPSVSPRSAPAFTEVRPLEIELPNAINQFGQAYNHVAGLLKNIADREVANFSGMRNIVRSCIDSISNNANAMFWLTRVRDQDAYTAEHCVRVGILAIAFGRYLGLADEQLETIGLCGMLHDVGKMRVSSAILNKPGALDDEEWRIMRQHPHLGFELLDSEHQLEPEIGQAALSHHERLDGKGYPAGLKADSIDHFTRIISIIDAYDAMTSDRVYRKGMPASNALSVLYKNSGPQFDAELVEVFIRMIGIYPPGSLVELNSGEVAIVLAASPENRLTPVVELVLDANGHPCEARVFNLNEQPCTLDGQVYRIAKALPDAIEGFNLSEYIRNKANLSSTAGS